MTHTTQAATDYCAVHDWHCDADPSFPIPCAFCLQEDVERLQAIEQAVIEWANTDITAPGGIKAWKRAHNQLRRLAGAPVLFPEVDQP